MTASLKYELENKQEVFTMTELENMRAGDIYDPTDEEIAKRRQLAHRLCKMYNDTFEEEEEKRKDLLDQIMPGYGEGTYLQGPIYFDYGYNIHVGKNFYANFNFTVLDICPVNIGDDVYIGPNVSLAGAMHCFDKDQRRMKKKADGSLYDLEFGKPITIGNDCWISSDVTIIGGVTIGDGCIIGAGSVVTRDIPANSLAAGNPCRVIREITEKDVMEHPRL